MFFALLNPSSNAYFEQTAYRLEGSLDVGVVAESLKVLMRRYDVLRTAFIHEGFDRPLQVVLKERPLDFSYEDLTEMADPEEQETWVRQFKENDRRRSFDLTDDVLLRAAVIRLGPRTVELIWSHHHIIMDGWCLGILFREFFEIYRCLLDNRPLQLPGVKPYRVYIQWLEQQDRQKSAAFWAQYLEGFEEATGIPRPAGRGQKEKEFEGDRVVFTFNREETAALDRLVRRSRVTLNIFIQAGWGILLGRYNGKGDVVFGAVVSGRPGDIEGVESMVGLFINTIPVRVRLNAGIRPGELLQQLYQTTTGAEPHHYYPLAEIQDRSVPKQHLLDHILVFENYPHQPEGSPVDVPGRGQGLGLTVTGIEGFERTNYDLMVLVVPGEQLMVRLDYNAGVYDRGFMEKAAAHFHTLCTGMAAGEDRCIDGISLLSPQEREQILGGFNDTAEAEPPLPCRQTIHRWFEDQAAATPHRIALTGPGETGSLSYRELNTRANQLGRLLGRKGVKADTVVGIMLERSPELVTAILGILKAGGACLPLDPEYPAERLAFMMRDCRIALLLTHLFTGERAGSFVSDGVGQIDVGDGAVYDGGAENPGSPGRESHLVYVIYTSGSTGTPKGVMLEHRNLVNLVRYLHGYTGIDFGTVLQFTTISFDVSFEEIFSCLLQGGELTLIHKDTLKEVPKLFGIVRQNSIRTLFLPTSFLKFVFREPEYTALVPLSVRHIVTAGEQLIVNDTFKAFLKARGVYLHNHYGPAETHVVTTYTVSPADDIADLPPIGKPILNTGIYILDGNRQVQPIGVPGELYIGGRQVGRGYWAREELTAERFVNINLAAKTREGTRSSNHQILNPKSQILYRTGDLARFWADGNIEFLGRIDHQVKIRGFRVEPGEIESQLLRYPGVREAAVIAREGDGGDRYLCAYVVVDEAIITASAVTAQLKTHLAAGLPDYMIPAYFVQLDRIPLDPNRKVDRSALPEPGIAAGEDYEAPANEVEEKLVDIWCRVLGLPPAKISVTANFFDLGGHSLKATILSARIVKELGVRVPLPVLLQHPTVRGLAAFVGKTERERTAAVEAADLREFYVLSSTQKRLYIIYQLAPRSTAYNMPHVYRLEGQPDRQKLKRTFTKLIHRHQGLRTSFFTVNGQAVQKILHQFDFDIEEGESSGAGDVIGDFVRPFDLTRPPLLRVGMIRLNPSLTHPAPSGHPSQEGTYVLVVDMPHIISDEVSFNILIEDFLALYDGRELPPLRLQYTDYAHWQQGPGQRQVIRRQEEYWLSQFKGRLPVLHLPLDYPRPGKLEFAGSGESFEIDAVKTEALKALARQERATLFMVLLTVYNILLAKLGRQEDIVVGTPVSGRSRAEFEQVIGVFVNMLALRNFPAGQQTFRQLLGQLRERTLAAFENQDYPFEELVDQLLVNRDASRSPLFDVLFQFSSVERHSLGVPVPGDQGIRIKDYAYEDRLCKYDLMLYAAEVDGHLRLRLEYRTALFKRETILELIRYLERIVTTTVENPDTRLSSIQLISQERQTEMQHLLDVDLENE